MTGDFRYQVRSAEDLGRAIGAARQENGATQQELAESLMVDRTYLAKIENGHSSPLLDLVFDVLQELELELEVRRRG